MSIKTERGGVESVWNYPDTAASFLSDDSDLLFSNAVLTAAEIKDCFPYAITQCWFLLGTVSNYGFLLWVSPHILPPVTRSKVVPEKPSVCGCRVCRQERRRKKVVWNINKEMKDGLLVSVSPVGYSELQNP